MHQAFSGRAKNWLRNPRLPEDAPSPIPHAGATGLTRIRALGIEIAEHARRVLASSRQIAHQTAIQSDHVQGSGSVIEDIAHIAGESARLYGIAQSRVAQARFQLEHCGQLSRNRNVTLDAIVQRVTDAQGNLTRLNATVDEVDMLLRQVADIGRQTDLLALNAAIEAARAGQQGEGFQVVAREMRDLADRTAHATTQIQQLTEGMRRSMNGSSTSLREACLNDRESANQAILAKQAYTLSLEAMTDAEQTAGQVVASAERQQKSAETLSQRWAPVLETAIDCGFDADACAERTQQTLELAARLGHELATIESAGRRLPPQRTPADSDQLQETIAAAMHALEAMIGGLGAPSRRRDQDPIPDLYFGTSRMNDRFDEVDALHRRTGFTTTLFVLGQRAGSPVFFRITTNVKRRNGDRVTLTPLNPKGDVARSLLAGQPTYGHVFILGAPYVAAYSPIKDPAGHVIGATYVGRAIDSA